MKFLDGKEEEYQRWKNKNSDPYSLRCFTYAEEWANLMEKEIIKGERIEEVADRCSRVADYDGITGFMYGCAVSILSKYWIYGKQLREWHNISIQLGNEGVEANKKGTVLNPALLSIKKS